MNYHQTHRIPLGADELIITSGAFGSGEHETTTACIKVMQEMDLAGKRVLDVGCGTGILSIAAHKLGAAQVVAFDISYNACVNTRTNFRQNNVEHIPVICGEADAVSGEYDVIIANIYFDIILALRPYFTNHLAKGGQVLCSGIPLEENYDVRRAYESNNFATLLLKNHEEYSTVLFAYC